MSGSHFEVAILDKQAGPFYFRPCGRRMASFFLFKNRGDGMTVNRADVERIAKLARLSLSADEITAIENDLRAILTYVDQIQTVDVEGVSAELDPVRTENVMRDDTVRPSLPQGAALKNAPDTDGAHFRVPPVLPSAEH